MTSVCLDLCLGVAQSLKQEIHLVILFKTLSAVNALRVYSITSQKVRSENIKFAWLI